MSMKGDMPKTGAELIAEERQRQIDEEGYTQDHDQQHPWEELLHAGMAYAVSSIDQYEIAQIHWPYRWGPIKSRTALDDLVRAGALIAASIDRLQYDRP